MQNWCLDNLDRERYDSTRPTRNEKSLLSTKVGHWIFATHYTCLFDICFSNVHLTNQYKFQNDSMYWHNLKSKDTSLLKRQQLHC